MYINQLTAVDDLAAADQFVIYSTSNGDARRVSASAVLAYLLESVNQAGVMTTQYAAPNATGFSVAIAPLQDGNSVYLNLTPLAGYAAGTIVLPAQLDAVDGQELLVTTTQAVTALTISGNGSTVNGAPVALAANAFFRLRYDAVLQTWQRAG